MKSLSRAKQLSLTFLLSFFLVGILQGQDPLRFKREVDSLVAANKSYNKSNVIVFTGSSSIRLWKDLKSTFPNHRILNLGFGGSEMADLLYYTDKLILSFRPKQIFIYEGDNDIASGKSPEQILVAANAILLKIRKELPESHVIFISAKPSIQRWNLKATFEDYNKKLKTWASRQSNVQYADVWTPMLDSSGIVLKDIFVEDGLHLNHKGYAIWTNVINKYLTPR